MPSVKENAIEFLKNSGQEVSDANVNAVMEQWTKEFLGDTGPLDVEGKENWAPTSEIMKDSQGFIVRDYKNKKTGEVKQFKTPVPIPEVNSLSGKPIKLFTAPKPTPTPAEVVEPTVAPTEPPVETPAEIPEAPPAPEPLVQTDTTTPATTELFKEEPKDLTAAVAPVEDPNTVNFTDEEAIDVGGGVTAVNRDGKTVLEKSSVGDANKNEPIAKWEAIEGQGVTADPRELYIRTTNVESDVGKERPELSREPGDVKITDKNVKEGKEAAEQTTKEKVPLQRVYDESISIIDELKKIGEGQETPSKIEPIDRKPILDKLKYDMTAADKIRFMDTFLGGLGQVTAGLVGQYAFNRPTPVAKYFRYKPSDVEGMKKTDIAKAKTSLDAIKEAEDFMAKIEKIGGDEQKKKLEVIKQRIDMLKALIGGTGTVTERSLEGSVNYGGGFLPSLQAQKDAAALERERMKVKGAGERAGVIAEAISSKQEKTTGESKESDVLGITKESLQGFYMDPAQKDLNAILVDDTLTPEERKKAAVAMMSNATTVSVGTLSKIYDDYVAGGGLERAAGPNGLYDFATHYPPEKLRAIVNEQAFKSGKKEGTKDTQSTSTKTSRNIPAKKEEPAAPAPKPVGPPAPPAQAPQQSVEAAKPKRKFAKLGKFQADNYPSLQTVIQQDDGSLLLLPTNTVVKDEKAKSEILAKLR